MQPCNRIGAGLGLKAEHYADALACNAEGLWYEVLSLIHI